MRLPQAQSPSASGNFALNEMALRAPQVRIRPPYKPGLCGVLTELYDCRITVAKRTRHISVRPVRMLKFAQFSTVTLETVMTKRNNWMYVGAVLAIALFTFGCGGDDNGLSSEDMARIAAIEDAAAMAQEDADAAETAAAAAAAEAEQATMDAAAAAAAAEAEQALADAAAQAAADMAQAELDAEPEPEPEPEATSRAIRAAPWKAWKAAPRRCGLRRTRMASCQVRLSRVWSRRRSAHRRSSASRQKAKPSSTPQKIAST